MSQNKKFFIYNLGKNFWLYRIAFIISSVGNVAISIAITWWIIDTYQKALYISYVMLPSIAISILSNFILSPLGDKFNRKTILIVGFILQILSCIIIVTFSRIYHLNLYLIILFQFLFSFGLGIIRVGGLGFLPNIVDKKLLLDANNIVMRINSVTSILAGSIGGIIFYHLGIDYSFIFLLTAQVIALMFIYYINPISIADKEKKEPSWIIKDLISGIKYTTKNKILRSLFIYSTIVGIAFGPMQIIIVYIIKMKLDMSSISYGLAMSAMSIGIILGSFLYKTMIENKHYKNIFIYFSSLLFSLAFLILGTFNNLFILFISLLIIGIARNWINVTIDTKLLKCLPNNKRTRVLSNMSFFGNISVPISNIFTGIILDNSNIGAILILNATIVLCASFIFVINKPVITFINSDDETSTDLLKK
ncbi:MFS transporter [Avibacterium paragallinarum]|uniref:MFS transporter n=1 Tax=Avibacterium paragallinarum TaxID=728 RepID=UPI00397848A0